MRRRRIWSETLPLEAFARDETTTLLRRFGLGVVVAVRPLDVHALPAALRALARAGVDAAVWPMLDDVDGRWAHAMNHARFDAFARRVVVTARECGAKELAVDLEPPIADVRAVLSSDHALRRLLGPSRRVCDDARETLSALVADTKRLGLPAFATALPLPVLEPGWEALLGTPLEGPAWSTVNVMLYTSMLEGWSNGLVGRDDALSILSACCRVAKSRYGARATVSLGVVGTGAFGDEPVYRDPAELARDVAVARASGVDDLVLFDLGGVLARPPEGAWLQAFTETAADTEVPHGTPKSRVLLTVLRRMGHWGGRMRR